MYPYLDINNGVKIHVSAVHISINFKLIFIFPIAAKALVIVVETEDHMALTENKPKAKSAGCHFWYLGITIKATGAKTNNPIKTGKIKAR